MADHEDIALLAYHLWEEQGRPTGRELEFWLEAEKKLTEPRQRGGKPSDQRSGTGVINREGENGDLPAITITAQPGANHPEHFVVLIGQGHMRIYRSQENEGGRARFELSESLCLPDGNQPSTGHPEVPGQVQITHPRSPVTELSNRLSRFLDEHREATWDYAAGPALHQVVLNRLSPAALARLEVALVKELNHQAPALQTDFAS